MTQAIATTQPQASSARLSSWSLLLNNRLAAGGLVILVLIGAMALLAPLLPIPDPDATLPANRLQPIFSDGHLLGTDHLGRDILARLIWGSRVSIAVGLSATLIAALIGSLIGLLTKAPANDAIPAARQSATPAVAAVSMRDVAIAAEGDGDDDFLANAPVAGHAE